MDGWSHCKHTEVKPVLKLIFRSLVWSEVSCELLNMEALIPKSQNMRKQVIDLCLYLKSHMIWMHIKVWEPLAILVNIWRWMLCGCCVNNVNGALFFYVRLMKELCNISQSWIWINVSTWNDLVKIQIIYSKMYPKK